MESSGNQAVNRLDTKLIELIKTNLTAIRPDVDWSQIEFEEDTTGNKVRLLSNDPALCAWLQQTITITRPDSNQQIVIYPNAFADRKM